MKEKQQMTGYPSIDKPWLKFYTQETLSAEQPNCDLYSFIFEANKNDLDGYALRYFEKRITYKEFFEGIRTATDAFQKLGVKKGDVVSFISLYTPEIIFCFYALNRLGAICNMLDPRTTPDGLCKRMENTASRILVIQDACAGTLDEIVSRYPLNAVILVSTGNYMGSPIKQLYRLKMMLHKRHFSEKTAKILIPWKDFFRSDDSGDIQQCNPGNIPAVIYYTGGTTGDPKGVVLSNDNINSISCQFAKLSLNDYKRGMTCLTPSLPFIAYMFVCGLHMAFAFGMECCIEIYDNKAIAKKIIKYKYQHLVGTPTMYDELITLAQSKKVSLDYLMMPIAGGDKMSEVQYQRFNDEMAKCNNEWKICNGYGMTEVSSGACICYKGASNKSGSVGIPLADTVITAFEPGTDKEVRQGEQGEICICGPGVMMGYYKNQEMTDSVIQIHSDGKRWMHTGDIGHVDEDGCVFIDGRMKRMIVKHDAFKVFPSAIEEKVLQCDKVANCCCIGIKDNEHVHGDVPVVFVVLKDREEPQTAKEVIMQFCRDNLADYAMPQEICCIDSLPLTHAGKVDYRALEELVKKDR